MRKFKCAICGYVYDEAVGIPEKGISPETSWEDISDDFTCPICTAPKSVFTQIEETKSSPTPPIETENTQIPMPKALFAGEISAICGNLAKGCEKQRLMTEMDAWNKLSDYYKSKTVPDLNNSLSDAAKMLADDLSDGFTLANSIAKADEDRGALRSLVWSKKVSMMMKTLLDRFDREGDALLENTKIYVCEICGFIHIGDVPPEICPVCKVPNFRITQVERR